jgi:RNA polymerase sigma-70 factor, ECF subfamily
LEGRFCFISGKVKQFRAGQVLTVLEDFAEILKQNQALVFRTLARLTGRGDHLEDLAQEVFLRLYRGLRNFRGEARVTTFLYRILVNVVNDEWRHRQLARRTVSIDEPETDWKDTLPERGPGPDRLVAESLSLEAFERALEYLSLRDRTILTLYHQEERTYEEVAEILNMPIGTVKTNLHRARQKLKAAMLERSSR